MRFVLVKRIQRSLVSVPACALKGFESGNEMAWDEHQLEIEGSRHVLDGREARVNRCALEIGDLPLSETQPARQSVLAELFPQACFAEQIGYRRCGITNT